MFYLRQRKNVVSYSPTTFYSILKVVPPGIEPGTQGFSVQAIENHNGYTVCILGFISKLSTYFG